ncbi:DUF58 domain-containing protein [Gryllotalpicola reticulitermitis]|uniref:DUF58 domain-containing protein n=1 Tax=Gryllotalpicola reticulitermitis TaxID=1184153 RepID=A0ABV8Q9Z1_9MICO
MSTTGMSDTREPSEPRWRLTVAQTGAVIVGSLAALAGVVSGHADTVVMGVPLLALAAWAWDRRPRSASGAAARDASPVEGPLLTVSGDTTATAGSLAYRVRVDPQPGVEAVQLRVFELGVHPRAHVLALAPGHPIDVRGHVPAPHSGPQRIVTVDWRLVASGGALITDVGGPIGVDRVITPLFTPIAALPLPHRLTGLTGAHDSSRPGDGGDFHDLAPFQPGDRLRRIDWKATARLAREPGELYVRRTRAQADATVFVVIDSGDDVGENVDTWARFDPVASGATTLDIARSAGSAIAAGYVRIGDRVGFADLGAPRRVVPAGGGSRHLDRLLRQIAATAPVGSYQASRRPPLVTQGALVYILSSYLDDRPVMGALSLAATGHRVVAVDVLPPPHLDELSTERRIAHRIVMMDRATRFDRLRGAGIDLLVWGTGRTSAERDAALLALARPGRPLVGVAR